MKKKTSIRDIAAALGVSPATVSLVLNGKSASSRISIETQNLVLEKAQQMGYVHPSKPKTESCTASSTPTFCMFFPVSRHDYAYAGALERSYAAVMHCKEEKRLSFNCLLQPYDLEKIQYVENMISKKFFDGIIMVGLSNADLSFLESKDWDVPIILYNRSSSKFACVLCEEYDSGVTVAKHFFARGHERYGVVRPTLIAQNSSLKYSGFVDTILKLGIPRENITVVSSTLNPEGGYEAALQLLRAEKKITAVFCLDDSIIRGLYKGIQQSGLLIPDDIEVVTAGDHGWANDLVPSVTNIAPATKECMASCISFLLQVCQSQSPSEQALLFRSRFFHPAQLICRESSPLPPASLSEGAASCQ